MKHAVHYMRGRRYLVTRWGETPSDIRGTFRFSPVPGGAPVTGLFLNWFNYIGPMPMTLQVGLTRNVRVHIPWKAKGQTFRASYAVLSNAGIVHRYPIVVERSHARSPQDGARRRH